MATTVLMKLRKAVSDGEAVFVKLSWRCVRASLSAAARARRFGSVRFGTRTNRPDSKAYISPMSYPRLKGAAEGVRNERSVSRRINNTVWKV
jgi:hypothetical protein